METRAPTSFFDSLPTALLAALAACLLAACGAGGDGSGGVGGTGLTGTVVSTGVMAKGSTILNGVHFEDTSADISIDDTPKTAAQLQDGMVVKLVGNVNADGITGSAQRINALIEVRGRPTSVSVTTNTQSLVLLGQTVLVDDQTIFPNLAFNAIVPGPTGTLIEVHGLRDTDGNIRATRIEGNGAQMADSSLDEIRGVVTGGIGTRPSTFKLGGQTINVGAAAVIIPTGASWPNGTVVEVYCSNRPCVVNSAFQASRLKVEDDSAFQPSSGERMEVEGLISGFSIGAQNFSVGSTPVTITSSTRFEGGISTDLANNIKVEAEGSWDGTRLVASKIEFKRSVVRLQGIVTSANTTLNQFTMDVAGHSVTIVRDSLTDGAVPPQGPACVQVRGQRTGSSVNPPVVTAGEIGTSCSGGNGVRPIIQAPVEAESGTTSLTLLGIPINVGSTSIEFKDINDVPMSRDAFFNAVTPGTTPTPGISVPGTLVKLTYNDNATTVKEVDIED